jgi:hypothetical protein
MGCSRKLWLALALILGAAAGALAHERLRVSGSGIPLAWSSPASIGIVINSDGSDDLPDGSHETALRDAIHAWNAAVGSALEMDEDTSDVQQARTDWESDNIHLILFDETNSSGFFGGGGIVAITPVWFFSNGVIVDADVLFNGSEFMFTTSGEANSFDVGDVGTHELGHLIGLDHSGWAGGTMYPYVDQGIVLQRSLSADDVCGARDIAPSGAFGTITGTVERLTGGAPVAGAHVVARSADGRPASSALTTDDGAFELVGLADGTYTVYADPLDSPVSDANLGDGHTIETDFETTFAAGPALVVSAGTFDVGPIAVGDDVALSLGSNIDSYPLRVVQGDTVQHLVRGSGLVLGSTLEVSDPDLALGTIAWLGNGVSFQVTAPLGEPRGHADLQVTTAGGAFNVLPGALEITPPSPSVASVTPSSGASAGGTLLTLSGATFEPGARVVIGSEIYRDGEPGGCTVVDASTITLTTLPTAAGAHDVVVIDESGVEGRKVDGFLAVALPSLTSVFPSAGDAAGGTEVVLRGTDFAAGLAVRIDGVTQSGVTVEDDTTARFATLGDTPGAYTLELENPGGGIAMSAFVYVAQADPDLGAAAPEEGGTKGGTTVTLTGAGFPADAVVVFGADPDTGLGGTPAAGVVFVDAGTLEVTTPAHAQGDVSIVVLDPSTGQASALAGAFTFVKTGGSGGGGCFTRPVLGPPANRGALYGAWWILLLLATTLWMRRGRSLRAAHAHE